MNFSRTPFASTFAASAVIVALCAAVPVFAAGKTAHANTHATTSADNSAAAARYKQDVANCKSGNTGQQLQTCLKEAGASYAEAKRGVLGNGETATPANATDRCQPLPDAERADCMARMEGHGTVSGSVSGGGVLRELRTVEPGKPTPQPPTSKSAPMSGAPMSGNSTNGNAMPQSTGPTGNAAVTTDKAPVPTK